MSCALVGQGLDKSIKQNTLLCTHCIAVRLKYFLVLCSELCAHLLVGKGLVNLYDTLLCTKSTLTVALSKSPSFSVMLATFQKSQLYCNFSNFSSKLTFENYSLAVALSKSPSFPVMPTHFLKSQMYTHLT